MNIEDFILTGKANAISLHELSRIIGISERFVKREILDARINRNQLVISDAAGYYFPDSEADIRTYVRARRGYIRTANEALKPFLDALRG